MKGKLTKIYFLVITGWLFLALTPNALAQVVDGEGIRAAEYAQEVAQSATEEAISKTSFGTCFNLISGVQGGRGLWQFFNGYGNIGWGEIFPALATCMVGAGKGTAADINSDQNKLAAIKTESEIAQETWRSSLAGAWKSMLSQFSKQLAYDTATFIASGGKGQQPLFITEGWDAYLRNSLNDAVGTFIEEVGQKRLGVDLCNPGAFRAGILIGISPTYRPKAKCTFSQMANNWQQSINDFSFSTQYVNSMGIGENDVSTFLTLQSDLLDNTNFTLLKKMRETAEGGWKDLTGFDGSILTPGTMIRAQHEQAMDDAGKEDTVFTGTIWDFIQTFLDTLVSKLLQNLINGFFSDNSGLRSNVILPSLPGYQSSPRVIGTQGAKDRFANLIESEFAVGGPYNILAKLATCSDSSKTNPNATDCVIDQLLSQAIREKTLVKQLPDSIKNRKFAPPINQVSNPQEEFTLRNIIILRKYRIVPVGWEIAARYISQQKDKSYTLGELMSQFYDSSSPLIGLVDPNWVLKAPELFCRREGFGAHNITGKSATGQISRSKYCADEQQCIKEGDNGNCLAYGYCTEEKRTWDLSSTQCEPRFNTCTTYTSASGVSASYLANTLDYRNCSAQNAGCRWYSMSYNTADAVWRHVSPNTVLKTCPDDGGCTVTGAVVPQWSQTSTDKKVLLSVPCTIDGGCDYTNSSCNIPPGEVTCSLSVCLDPESLVAGLNPSLAVADGAVWNAKNWLESYQNDNNRQFRSLATGHTDSISLESRSSGNPLPLVATLPGIEITPDQANYTVKFYAKGGFNVGGYTVEVYSNEAVLGRLDITGLSNAWQQFAFNFATDEQIAGPLQLKITTLSGTIGTAYFDDFDIKKIRENCEASEVWLTRGAEIEENKEIYFDGDAASCPAASAGCSQFIRTKTDLGSNLLLNPGLELISSDGQFKYWVKDAGSSQMSTTVKHSGERSALLQLNSGYHTDLGKLKAGHYLASIWVYTAFNSGDVKLIIKNSVSGDIIKSADLKTGDSQWHRLTVPFETDGVSSLSLAFTHSGQIIGFLGDDGNSQVETSGLVYFDDAKLEKVSADNATASAYTPYDPSQRPENQLAYLKKAPDYLKCYLTLAGNWPTSTPELLNVISKRNPACSSYASVCIESEMDCELYTPTNGDPAVPGTVTSADVCPAVCANYQVYKQEPTSFTSAKYEQFINKAPIQYCSAAAVGCDEFTNLDEAKKGGEALEYYSQFRVCQKPEPYTDEATYYTWEGSDTTGYQLKVFNLKKSNSSPAPCTNLSYPSDLNGENVCFDPEIGDSDGDNIQNYNDPDQNAGACLPSDLNANPDCREFYDTTGAVHYRLLSKVVYVSSECHPYRRTQTQTDLASAALDCRQSQGYWNSFNECLYMAIPQQGKTCSANLKGCREYTGNRGNSFINLFLSDFESGAMGWNGGTITSEASHPGGNSLTNSLNNSRKLTKKVQIKKGRSYVVSFWAKGANNFSLDSIKFSGAPAESSFIVGHPSVVTAGDLPVPITSDWNKYELGPVFVNWGEKAYFEDNLEINIPGEDIIFLDNIILKELPQSVYALANSWFTPVACDNKIKSPYGTGDALNPVRSTPPGEMLGCQEYTDRSQRKLYLKSFENLCRREAVGCEELIDTYNSNSPEEEIFNAADSSKITVPADKTVYLVNDEKFRCDSDNKGCSALGLPQINNREEVVGYSTVYLKNQPDRYSTDLCQVNALWCEAFTGSRNTAYFKNPRDKICEYKKAGTEQIAGWYQKGTDQLCSNTLLQTIGTGNSEAKKQPVGWFNNLTGQVENGYAGWAGVCPVKADSCSEYIDPLAVNYPNQISQSQEANRWETENNYKTQTVELKTHTLYTLSVGNGSANDAFVISQCEGDYGDDYQIVSPDLSATISAIGNVSLNNQTSGRFYIISSQSSCNVKVYASESASLPDIKLVETGVYYALSNKVDRSSCNGLVDFNNGCVLFNDRGEINYGQSAATERLSGYLKFDADATYQNQFNNPNQLSQSPVAGKNSSLILKVKPDRVCSSWLYCTSYEKNNLQDSTTSYTNQDSCLNLGLCTSLNEKGECDNFEILQADDQAVQYDAGDVNKTGYAQLGKSISGYNVTGYYPYNLMTQIGASTNVPNGNFESAYSGTFEPIGWYTANEDIQNSSELDAIKWTADKFKLESVVKNRQEGASYLRLNAAHEAESEEIDVRGNSEYILTAWLNSLNIQPDGTYAQIQIKEMNNDVSACQSAGAGVCKVADGGWQIWQSLTLKNGLPWTKVTQKILLNQSTRSLKIKLVNYNNTSVKDNITYYDYCHDDNINTECLIGGYSLIDDISLKPVLKVNENDLISRECRLYPAQDALSCKYFKDNSLFYGLYGYCLVSDPQNPSICLQWWPVDQLKGESIDEVSSYADRVPLYYCAASSIDLKERTISTTQVEVVEGAGGAFGHPNCLTFEGDQLQSIGLKPEDIDDINLGNISGASISYSDVLVDNTRCSFPTENNYTFRPLSEPKPTSAIQNIINSFINGSIENILNIVERAIGTMEANSPGLAFILNQYGISDIDQWFQTILNNNEITIGADGNIQLFSNGLIFELFNILYPNINSANGNDLNFYLGYVSVGQVYCAGFISFYEQDNQDHKKGDLKSVSLCAQDTYDYSDIDHHLLQLHFNYLNGFDTGYVCDVVARVVTPTGTNQAWSTRVASGSLYAVTSANIVYGSDYKPFGSLVSPTSAHYPSTWDAKSSVGGQQQLNHEPPNKDFQPPYQSRAGAVFGCAGKTLIMPFPPLYATDLISTETNGLNLAINTCSLIGKCSKSQAYCLTHPYANRSFTGLYASSNCPIEGEICVIDKTRTADGSIPPDNSLNEAVLNAGRNRLKLLFAKSYGLWQWDKDDSRYKEFSETGNWDVPTDLCSNNIRPASGQTGEYCAVAPVISNVAVNGQKIANVKVKQNGGVLLEFNVQLNPEQLPLTSYSINWGDGDVISQSGISLRSRPNALNTLKLYHFYDYWQVQNNNEVGNSDGIYCSDDDGLPPAGFTEQEDYIGLDYCVVQPQINVLDNWGWCNGNTTQAGDVISTSGSSAWGYYSGNPAPSNCDSSNSNAWTKFNNYIVITK